MTDPQLTLLKPLKTKRTCYW